MGRGGRAWVSRAGRLLCSGCWVRSFPPKGRSRLPKPAVFHNLSGGRLRSAARLLRRHAPPLSPRFALGRRQPMVSSVVPSITLSPALTQTPVTVPSVSAVMLFSIFMASSTSTVSPFFTA